MLRRTFIATALILCINTLSAQSNEHTTIDNDTLRYRYTPIEQTIPESGKSRGKFAQKILDYINSEPKDVGHGVGYSIIGGPGYSAETSLRLAILGRLDYRPKLTSVNVQPSDVALSAMASITGFYRIALTGNNFFGDGRHRLMYRAEFRSQPTNFWGLNYDASLHNAKGKYTSKRYLVWARYNYLVFDRMYLGAYADYRYLNTIKPDTHASAALDGSPLSASAAGIGINLGYDSRDITINAAKGIYAAIEFMVRPEPLNNVGSTMWQLSTTVDFYQPLWKGGTLAVDLYGEFHSSTTPWMLRAQLGDDYRMRGYYPGRFNGTNLVTAQAELRQHIWKRLGCTAWGGAGVVFSKDDPFAWRKVLPNYGVGLRWEFRKRSNLRIDCGFGRKSMSFVMAINEAF